MPKPIALVLLIGLLVSASAYAQTPYQTKRIDTKIYRLVVPEAWQVKLDPQGSSMRFFMGENQIGEVQILGYYPRRGRREVPTLNHSEVLSVEWFDGFVTNVAKVKLILTPPAAANENWERHDTLFYFLQPERKRAVQLRFYDEYVDEETALGIAKSVQIREYRPSLSIQ